MDIMRWIKKFYFKVWNKIEDHFATVVAGGIILIASALCIVSWEWLKTKHSLEMYGWCWLLLSVLYVFLISYFLLSVFCERGKPKDPQSIKNTLHKYLRHCTDNQKINQENVFTLAAIDKQQKLRRGSAKKYLKEVIQETPNWTVISEGDKNLRVKRDDSKRMKDMIEKCI